MKLNRILAGAFALLLTVGVSVQSNATDINKSNEEITVKVDPKKTEISASDLPAAVKQAIVNGDYAKWSIAKAYKVMPDEAMNSDKEAEVQYEVHFQNANQDQEVAVYDESGKSMN